MISTFLSYADSMERKLSFGLSLKLFYPCWLLFIFSSRELTMNGVLINVRQNQVIFGTFWGGGEIVVSGYLNRSPLQLMVTILHRWNYLTSPFHMVWQLWMPVLFIWYGSYECQNNIKKYMNKIIFFRYSKLLCILILMQFWNTIWLSHTFFNFFFSANARNSLLLLIRNIVIELYFLFLDKSIF